MALSLTAGTKAPVYGSGAGAYPPAGFTGLVGSSFDDTYTSYGIDFNFYMAGTAYTTVYISSNTYLTFGGGSGVYSSLSKDNPNLPKFFFGSADNSYQRVSAYKSIVSTIVRYEGTAATSGTPGSPNIVYEATLYNPNQFGGSNVIELLVGVHSRTSGIFECSSASTPGVTLPSSGLLAFSTIANAAVQSNPINLDATAMRSLAGKPTPSSIIAVSDFYSKTGPSVAAVEYATSTIAANQSYVFYGNSTGTSWTLYTGYYIDGTPV